MIDQPGIYEINPEEYHQDPCPEPSLSSSGIRRLLNATPAHFQAKHPRLSPWPIDDNPTKEQDLGTVIHKLLLGRGRQIDVFDFKDWRKDEAKAKREESRAAGHVPVLRDLWSQAQDIADKAEGRLRDRFGAWPPGKSEQTLIWQRRTSEGSYVWCRALTDSVIPSLIVDLKTTGLSLADHDLAAKLANEGADVQASFYLDGLGTLFPEHRGRQHFIFAAVETEPPYAVRFAELPKSWTAITDQRIDRVVDLFARCLAANEWPSWPMEARIDPPGWLSARWQAEISLEESHA